MSLAVDPLAPLAEAAAKISTEWSLAAFAGVVLLAIVLSVRRKGPTPPVVWAAVGAVVLVTLAPIGARAYIDAHPPAPGVYRVYATVLDAHGTPVDDARVWSDAGGQWLRADGAYQVVIPAATLPASRRLVVRAARAGAFETAVDSVALAGDYNPTLTLRLRPEAADSVRGTVVDARGHGVAGVRVSVDGYAAEARTTDAGGGFVLPAHAADGQQVLLRADKPGVGATTLYHPAGRAPATLQLDGAGR